MAKRELLRTVISNVLREEKKPLRVNEIYLKIKEDNLYVFKTDDPVHIVRTLLRRHSLNIDFPSAKKKKYFQFLDDGKFWLKDEPLGKQDLPQKIFENETNYYAEVTNLHRKYLSDFKRKILKQLLQIDPENFEHFCKGLLVAYGFKNMKVTRLSRDGGIDGHGDLKMGLTSMPVAFECKRWTTKNVGVDKITQFRGTLQGDYTHGVFFTTSSFTKEAKSISYKKGATPVILIDGRAIVDLMIEKEFGVDKEMLPLYSNAIDLILQKQ